MKIEVGPKAFTSFAIDGRNVEGGIVLTTRLLCQRGDGAVEVVDEVTTIVPGRGNALNSRVRKAVKSLMLGAFPKPVKDIPDGDETLPLPGTN